MPELPDITVYINALRERVLDERLEKVRVLTPFLLRTFDPPVSVVEGKNVRSVSRLGKRIVFGLDEELFVVLHLMIAGRLHWKPAEYQPPRKGPLAAFIFSSGVLVLTEAGTKRRASRAVYRGEASMRDAVPVGLEVLGCTPAQFREVLDRENHTLKRSLTDPRLFSGIGNAFSDEILHCARLSPVTLTRRLSDADTERLYHSTQEVLTRWCVLLDEQRKGGFPEKVTAFRPEMLVHGKYGQPCAVCGTPIQRIVYADNETNYCPRCQTGGRLLADRSLSRLLRQDWPKSLEELEERMAVQAQV
jgi:formamidopyrimidine-DNA glycosylase